MQDVVRLPREYRGLGEKLLEDTVNVKITQTTVEITSENRVLLVLKPGDTTPYNPRHPVIAGPVLRIAVILGHCFLLPNL